MQKTMTHTSAAIEQLTDAIMAWKKGHFASAITLAGAAEEILPAQPDTLFDRLKSRRFPADVNKEFAALSSDERGRHFNGTRNWLKHHIENGPTRNIDNHDAELMIARALHRLLRCGFNVRSSEPEIRFFCEKFLQEEETS